MRKEKSITRVLSMKHIALVTLALLCGFAAAIVDAIRIHGHTWCSHSDACGSLERLRCCFLPLCLLGNGFSLGVQKMGIGLLNGWPRYVIAFPSLGDINSSF